MFTTIVFILVCSFHVDFLVHVVGVPLFCTIQVPHLPHHVVLRELKLEDNSLTDVSPLCRAWLPLLQTLSLARNW